MGSNQTGEVPGDRPRGNMSDALREVQVCCERLHALRKEVEGLEEQVFGARTDKPEADILLFSQDGNLADRFIRNTELLARMMSTLEMSVIRLRDFFPATPERVFSPNPGEVVPGQVHVSAQYADMNGVRPATPEEILAGQVNKL